MLRQFVRLTTGGIVDQDLELDGPGAATAAAPPRMIEVTGHPQWAGLGSLLRRSYDANTQTFGAPPVVTTLARMQWLELFTASERQALRALMRTDALVEDATDLLSAAESIDRASPRVAQYLSLLVVKNILTPARRAAILAGTAP